MKAGAVLAAIVAGATIGCASCAAAASHDGSRDFDFDVGTWSMHARRLTHPLSGASDWMEMDGTTTVRPLAGGRANLAEVETDGPAGHFEMLALRLYDPVARQWTIRFANSRLGVLDAIPLVGEFRDGVGTFYDDEPFAGRTIRVRFVIDATSPDTAHSEQAFSDDQGRTWETNWITDYRRTAPAPG